MAWNEKALKNIRPKKQALDRFDLEAEREGNARKFFQRNQVGPAVLGKAISKQRRAADGNAKTADLKATRHIVRETAEIASRIVTTERSLKTVRK